MENTIFQFILDFIVTLTQFGSWLSTDLPGLGISPLGLFTFGGITVLVGFLVVRLVIG